MIAFSVLIMIFGTIVFIPCVLGKDVVVDLAKSFDKLFDRPYMFPLFSVGIVRISLPIILTIGSTTFWYSWSVSSLKNKTPLLIVSSISIVSVGLIYLIYQYLLRSPLHNHSTSLNILFYIVLFVSLLGSMGLVWIPLVVFFASRFWRLLVNMPLLVSGISGYILFNAGLFLFLITNQ